MEATATREWITNELMNEPELQALDVPERLASLLARHDNAAHAAELAGDNYTYLRESAGARFLQLLIVDETMKQYGYQRKKAGPGDWIRKK